MDFARSVRELSHVDGFSQVVGLEALRRSLNNLFYAVDTAHVTDLPVFPRIVALVGQEKGGREFALRVICSRKGYRLWILRNPHNADVERLRNDMEEIFDQNDRFILVFRGLDRLQVQGNSSHPFVQFLVDLCTIVNNSDKRVMIFFIQQELITPEESQPIPEFRTTKLYAPPLSSDEVANVVQDLLEGFDLAIHPRAQYLLQCACIGYTYGEIRDFFTYQLAKQRLVEGEYHDVVRIESMLAKILYTPNEAQTAHLNAFHNEDSLEDQIVYSLKETTPYEFTAFLEEQVDQGRISRELYFDDE